MASQHDNEAFNGTTFVDYVPPPAAPVSPPAKYKLWLIVLTLVFFASWFAEEAGFLGWIESWKILSPELSFFVMLGVIVLCLTYAALDLFVACFTLTVGGKSYGLGPWLRQPRVRWILKYHNFPAEFLAIIISILEDGFAIFDAPPPIQIPIAPKHYLCKKKDCNVMLRIEHDVDPNKFDEYLEWEKKILKVVKTFDGFKYVKHLKRPETEGVSTTLSDSPSLLGQSDALSDPPSLMNQSSSSLSHNHEAMDLAIPGPDASQNLKNVREDEDVKADVLEEGRHKKGRTGSLAVNSSSEAHSPSHVIVVKFSDIDKLNEYMASSKRRKLMDELEPLLLKPDVLKIQASRALPDAFTELLTRQGEAVPDLAPKKWKVAWLTTVALYFCRRWTEQFLPYYFSFWNLDGGHPRLQAFVSNAISTFLNAYGLTPLVLFLFSDWVRRKPDENDNKQPWKALNDGFQLMWQKALVAFAFYGGCLIVWIVETYA